MRQENESLYFPPPGTKNTNVQKAESGRHTSPGALPPSRRSGWVMARRAELSSTKSQSHRSPQPSIPRSLPAAPLVFPAMSSKTPSDCKINLWRSSCGATLEERLDMQLGTWPEPEEWPGCPGRLLPTGASAPCPLPHPPPAWKWGPCVPAPRCPILWQASPGRLKNPRAGHTACRAGVCDGSASRGGGS